MLIKALRRQGVREGRMSSLDHRHYEFVPLVVGTQRLHVRQIRLPLGINPLDIGGVFEVTSCWFVEGLALLICKELLHPTARDILHPCLLSAAKELLRRFLGPRIFGVIV